MSTHERFGVARPNPITEAKLFNAARPTVTLLVEGELDTRFWRIWCDCRVWPRGGRDTVLRELDRARQDPEVRLIAVLDADLDRLEGTLPDLPDVIWTDAHDLETTLLGTPALEKLIRQSVDPAALHNHESRWHETFRARLFRHAAAMGRLRWLKRLGCLELIWAKPKKSRDRFERFDAYDRCADKSWSPSLTCAFAALLDYNSAHHLRARDITAECAALPAADNTQLCNGHDLLGYLKAGVEAIDPREKRSVDAWGELLVLAAERAWLTAAAMWRALEAWEQAHPGYRIFARATPPATSPA